MAQHGKLVSQDSGRSSFNLLHDSSRGLLRPALQKEVDMVVMTLHRKDFDIELLARLPCEFLETVFHMRNVENLAPIPRAKDEMVVDEGDGGSRPEIFIHASIILQCICISNRQTHKRKEGARLIPRLKSWACAAPFCIKSCEKIAVSFPYPIIRLNGLLLRKRRRNFQWQLNRTHSRRNALMP